MLLIFCSFIMITTAINMNKPSFMGKKPDHPEQGFNPAMNNLITNMEKQLEQAKLDGDDQKVKALETKLTAMRNNPRNKRRFPKGKEEL